MTAKHETIPESSLDALDRNLNWRQPHPLLDRGALAVLLVTILAFFAPTVAWVAWGPPLAAGSTSPLEIRMLVWSALLSLLLPVAQIVIHIRSFGGDTIRGNRENYPSVSGVAARIARAHANLVENLVPFAAVILSLQVLGVSNRVTLASSVAYFVARLVHSLSYVFGVTHIRSAAFYGGLGATIAAALQLPVF
jgi:uncharacterized MAPEG superfamily protein